MESLFKEEYLSEWDKLNELWSQWEQFALALQNKEHVRKENVHDILQEKQQILLVLFLLRHTV